MSGWTPGPWVEAGKYGLVGYEIQGGGQSIAIVNRVGSQRLDYLNEKRSKAVSRGTPEAAAESEAASIEAGAAEALANTRMMVAAPDLYEACCVAYSALLGAPGPADESTLQLLSDAIAKAEGRP